MEREREREREKWGERERERGRLGFAREQCTRIEAVRLLH